MDGTSVFLVFLAIGIVSLDILLVWHLLTGAPYIPTKAAGVEKILRCCHVRSGMRIADIGSGDGRVLIVLARAGAETHGYEINPLLVWWSRRKIRRSGLEGRAFVHWQNMWKTDFSSFDVVTLFGAPHIMRRLQTKLQKELRPGARVVSIGFTFPDWEVAEKIESVFVFERVATSPPV